MGVIYKLKPEIKDYILEEKKTKPILSCRGLVALVENKFQVKISKSSINAIIKELGLSMPVGRRHKKRRKKLQIPTLPQIEIKSEIPLLETEAKKLLEAPVETVVEKVVEEVSVEKTAQKPVEPPPQTPPEKIKEVPVEKIPEPEPVEIEAELPSEMPCTGAILLKAADYLIGGSLQISELIKNRLNREEKDLLATTESLIYMPLFEISTGKELTELWPLVDKKITQESLIRYLNELQEIKQLPLDIWGIISGLFKEVRCVKVSLQDETTFYWDGQLHTVWSTPQIPYDFSTTIYNIKSYINKYFKENRPFILFSAPGYDTPTKEFFDFILSLEGVGKDIFKLTLYDHRLKEIEVIPLYESKKPCFIFGLWPWQFGQFRKVKSIGDFKLFYLGALKKLFYLASVEIELLQPVINKTVVLKGCALKTNLNEKIKLVILSNFEREMSIEELANLYLNHWPNLEEGFQDFSRKIEFFTYTANSQRFFSIDNLNITPEVKQDITSLFDYYLRALDFYVRWHFLPSGYEDKDFSTIKGQFYDLRAILKKEKEQAIITFQPPAGFGFLKELEYVCRRLNEREIAFRGQKRVRFSI